MRNALRPSRRLAPNDPRALSATPLSGSLEPRAEWRMDRRVFRAMARPSLCVLFAIMPAGCLVTSVPEFEEPAQTPPFLVASAADPDIREFVLVVDGDDRKDFNAAVISEDRGQPVQVALYIDYGEPNSAGHPFKRAIAEFPDIPAATLADGARTVSTQWFLDSADVTKGCHTITMMVTHEFDFRHCPVKLEDSSHLVWKVIRCTSKELCAPIDPFKDCPNSAEDPLVVCPSESPGPDAGAGDGGSP